MSRQHFMRRNNLNALHEAILAARPDLAESLRVEGRGDDLWIAAPDEADAQIAALVAAHDPALLSKAQQIEQRRDQARADLEAADLDKLADRIEAARDVAELGAQVAELARLLKALREAA